MPTTITIDTAPTIQRKLDTSKTFPNWDRISNLMIQGTLGSGKSTLISELISNIIFDYAPFPMENLIIMDYAAVGEFSQFNQAATIIKDEDTCIQMLNGMAPVVGHKFIVIDDIDNFVLFRPGNEVVNGIRTIKKHMPSVHIIASSSSFTPDLPIEELISYFPTKIILESVELPMDRLI